MSESGGIVRGVDDVLPKVIYIAGYGRSGSTLLDIILGAAPNVEGFGEVVHCFSLWAGEGYFGDKSYSLVDDHFWENVRSSYLASIRKKRFLMMKKLCS